MPKGELLYIIVVGLALFTCMVITITQVRSNIRIEEALNKVHTSLIDIDRNLASISDNIEDVDLHLDCIVGTLDNISFKLNTEGLNDKVEPRRSISESNS